MEKKLNLNFKGIFKTFGLYRQFYSNSRLDDLIRLEVIPYVKRFGSLSLKIQEEAKHRAEHESAYVFLNNLKYWWNKHNELAYQIDQFLVEAMDWSTMQIKKQFITEALFFYEEAHQVETNKRIYSAAVKIFLDRYIPLLTQRYFLTSEDLVLLTTLWELSYWHLSKKWHIAYLLYLKGQNEEFVIHYQYYLDTFHSGDENLLKERMDLKEMSNLNNLSEDELIKELELLKKLEDELQSKKVNAFYLCIERPDLKAISEIIRYDNLVEYIFGINLYGLPDLFLRKGVVNTLISANLINKKESILEYDLSEIERTVLENF